MKYIEKNEKEEETNVTINTKTKIITDFVDPKEVKEVQKEIRKANIEVTEGSVTAVFRMKKTDIIDVYNLYLGTTIKKGDKKLFKYQKIDIAYIPTKECSYFCKDAFSKIYTDSLLVRCKYEKEKSRWIPVELVTNQKISDSVDKIKDFIN